MKLRIQNNSLRFRLTQSEVMRLMETGQVEDEVRFTADRALHYSVASNKALKNIKVEYAADCLRVLLPAPSVLAWAESDQVCIANHGGAGHGRVQVLVEKDFPCLHGSDRNKESLVV
jgi:hypothetical protein